MKNPNNVDENADKNDDDIKNYYIINVNNDDNNNLYKNKNIFGDADDNNVNEDIDKNMYKNKGNDKKHIHDNDE